MTRSQILEGNSHVPWGFPSPGCLVLRLSSIVRPQETNHNKTLKTSSPHERQWGHSGSSFGSGTYRDLATSSGSATSWLCFGTLGESPILCESLIFLFMFKVVNKSCPAMYLVRLWGSKEMRESVLCKCKPLLTVVLLFSFSCNSHLERVMSPC